ncbi:fermentation associated protein [Gigaspora margarita]|uniref:Fermentation associated protein n=1 Tax=Gigaspora margarita TaxID=4874 RepID=A0A8H3ZZB6_GIGMA|nr:fermentation associated protein [Gigaspora margarita]
MTTDWKSFLAYCLVIAFVVLFLLFYFNRIIAYFLSHLIRIYTWRKYNAYIEIGSIQFAPLAGRILFKNLKYYSTNQSFSVLKGYITCQYWLWSVREEYKIQENTNDSINENELPCRIKCHVDGVEWFVYNRTSAYEILAKVLSQANHPNYPTESLDSSSIINHELDDDIAIDLDDNDTNAENNSSDSFFLKLLPIQIDCVNGAFIFGNAMTSSLLVMKFSQASGIYGAVKSRSKFDYYKSITYMRFREPQILLKSNPDYKETCLDKGARLGGENVVQMDTVNKNRCPTLLNKLLDFVPFLKIPSSVGPTEWHGLPRYRTEETDNKCILTDEYAKVSTVLDCLLMEMTYYADVPGRVPQTPILSAEEVDIGNGDLSPEWGVDLTFTQAQINYGPWADRQRTILQNFFFPPLYRNSEQTKKLSPGQTRLHTSFKILVQFNSPVTLRVPLREISKDWKYSQNDSQEEFQIPSSQRQYGWLEINANSDSTISMTMPMVLTDKGYSNNLIINFEDLDMQTSVNDSRFIKAEKCEIKCDLPSPLVWNQSRTWEFDIYFMEAEIFLLRDHITLFQDLIKDWTSGPSPDKLHFIPIKYKFNPRFTNFKLYLYVNEHNIINDPTDIGENTFIIIRGSRLASNIVAPFLSYNQEITKILFDMEITNGRIVMSPQVSQTLGTFLTEYSKDFFQVNSFSVDGNFQYYSFIHPNHVESLSMTMKGKEANLKLFGFVIRYFIILQMNYAGNYINFCELKEYVALHDPKNATGTIKRPPQAIKPPADPYEVYVTFIIEDGTLILPENLYNANEQSSRIHFHELQLELRNLDLYMDMDLTISPLTWTLGSDPNMKTTSKSRLSKEYTNYLFIDDLNIHAHRLFGPLPRTATYVCNWELNIGTISGQLRPSFLLSTTSFGKAFSYHYVDDESALPPDFLNPLDADVTFLNLNLKEVDISVWGGDSVSQILLKEGLCIKFDDLANEKYTQRVLFDLPDLVVRSLAMSASNLNSVYHVKDGESHPFVEVASFECAFNISLYHTISGWRQRFASQQAHLKEQDKETLRIPFLYGNGNGDQSSLGSNGFHFGALYTPPMPTPLPDDTEIYSVLINESANSSMVDLSASQNRKNIKNMLIFDHHGDDGDDYDMWLRTDDDNVSIITGSGISMSNASFVTASDGDEDDKSLSDNDDATIGHNTPIIIDDTDSDYYVNKPELSPDENQYSMSPPVAKSIPYGSYLRRYKQSSLRPSAAQFQSSFLQPPRVSFIPARDEVLSPDEKSPSFKSSPFSKLMSESTTSSDEIVPDQSLTTHDEAEEKTTIIFETTKTVKVLLTPIFLKIVEEFLEAIKKEDWNMEAMFDKMQIDYVGELTKLFPFKFSTTIFGVSIHKVHLHFIQDVMLPDDLTNANDEYPSVRARYDLTDTILCAAADLVIDKILMNVLNISLERLKLKWTGGINMKTNNFSFDLENVFSCFINQSPEILTGAIYWWLVFAKDLSNILEKFESHRIRQTQTLVHEIAKHSKDVTSDPQYLATPSHVLRLSAKNLKNNDGWKILGRLRYIKKQMQLDQLEKLQGILNSSDYPSVSQNKMYKEVIDVFLKWRNWEMENVQICQLFTDLFRQPTKDSSSSNDLEDIIQFLKASLNCFKLRIGNVSVSVWESQRENSVGLGPIVLDFETTYHDDSLTSFDVIRPNTEPGSFSTTSGQSQISHSMLTGDLNITVRFGVEQIGIDVNPDMLAFAKHWLKVHRIFRSKFESLSSKDLSTTLTQGISSSSNVHHKHKSTGSIASLNEIKLAKLNDVKQKNTFQTKDTLQVKDIRSRLNIYVQGVMIIKKISITASAQKLIAFTQLSNINTSIWLHNPRTLSSAEKSELENVSVNKSTAHPGSKTSGSRGSKSLIFSAIGGIRNILINIKEKTSGSTGPNTLLSIEFTHVDSSIAISSPTISRLKSKLDGELPRVLNVFLTLQSISIKLPQSLLKLYHFVEEWREENLPSYDFLYKNLKDEFEEQRKILRPPTSYNIRPTEKHDKKNVFDLKFQFLLKKVSLQTHLLPSLRFHYDAWDFLMILEQRNSLYFGNLTKYLGQLAKQEIHFVTRQKNPSKSGQNEKSIMEEPNDNLQKGAFTIPAIRAIGKIKPFEPSKNTNVVIKKNTSPLGSPGITPNITPKHLELESTVTLDFVQLNLNVNIIDNLLTAQSLLGNEFNDVLDVFVFSSKKLKAREVASKDKSSSSVQIDPSKQDKLYYKLQISLRGLKVSAESPTAIGFFETNILNGHITNIIKPEDIKSTKIEWHFSAKKFSLSLNHNTGIGGQLATDDDVKKYRIAYIIIDLTLQNFKGKQRQQQQQQQYSTLEDTMDITESYFLKLTKANAVMQPIALGRLMDVYAYYSGELERRKKLKSSEINKLTESTRRLWKSLNIEKLKYKSKSKTLLDEKVLSLEIMKFAVALPLDLKENSISTAMNNYPGESSHVSAFIFSASSMNFITRKWKSNYATLKDLCFQFVTEFDQRKEELFSSYVHSKMNRVYFPEISCEGYSSSTANKKKFDIQSRVEGFEMDVASNIVTHINCLGEIYAASREQLETFTAEANLDLGSEQKSVSVDGNDDLQKDTDVIDLEFEVAFTAKSGTIKLYPKSYFSKNHSRRPTGNKMSDKSKSARGSRGSIVSLPKLNLEIINFDDVTKQEHGIDTITIPGLSINTIYRTFLSETIIHFNENSSLTRCLHVELVIHPSTNILFPSLVPFFKDIIDGLKIGVQQSSDKKAIAIKESASPIQGLNITFHFRLLHTNFELSCKPLSKVFCCFNWEEGNFLISSSSAEEGSQSVTCVGKISGASGNIRHAFSPEDCVKAEIKDISFNATMMSRRSENVSDDSISIIVELPQISADLNIRYLQDPLVFKIIWLDQAAKLYEAAPQQQQSQHISGDFISTKRQSSPSPSYDEEPKVKPYSFYAFVKLNRLDLSSDLGQAIGKVLFNTQNVQVRTKNVPGVQKRLIASTDVLNIKCEGRLIGSASIAGLTFSTVLGIPPHSKEDSKTCVTNLLFKSERIQTSFEYEFQTIIVLDVDPMKFKLTDSWEIVSPENASVLVHADISLRQIQAIATIKTIPTIIHMLNKLLALVEEKQSSAARAIIDSKFNSSNIETLSYDSGSDKLSHENTDITMTFKEVLVGGLTVHPIGKITITIDKAYFTIFPNNFYDIDCLQTKFDGLILDMNKSIKDEQVYRELNTRLNGIALLKSSCKKLKLKDDNELTLQKWFEHVEAASSKNIFTLPNTNLIMDTTQKMESNNVDHKFEVHFGGKVDIALNFGLIRYIQELSALYKEQLKKNVTDIPKSPNTASTSSTGNPLQSPVTTPPLPTIELPSLDNEDLKEVKNKDIIIYNPIEPTKLEPQLRYLGDATPPLEWVGVQRAKVPGFVHTTITMNLDEIINHITNKSFKAAQALL